MNFDELSRLLDPLRDSPWLPLLILVGFLVAGMLFVSVWLVIFQTGLLVPPPGSFLLALTGALLSASAFWLLGRFGIGTFVARRGSNRVLRAVQGAGLEGIVALRLLPLLPFTLVNVSAGALGVPFRTFVAGTVLGMTPGILAMTLLGDRALAVLKDPSLESFALLAGAAVLLFMVSAGLRSVVRRRQSKRGPEGTP